MFLYLLWVDLLFLDSTQMDVPFLADLLLHVGLPEVLGLVLCFVLVQVRDEVVVYLVFCIGLPNIIIRQ